MSCIRVLEALALILDTEAANAESNILQTSDDVKNHVAHGNSFVHLLAAGAEGRCAKHTFVKPRTSLRLVTSGL